MQSSSHSLSATSSRTWLLQPTTTWHPKTVRKCVQHTNRNPTWPQLQVPGPAGHSRDARGRTLQKHGITGHFYASATFFFRPVVEKLFKLKKARKLLLEKIVDSVDFWKPCPRMDLWRNFVCGKEMMKTKECHNSFTRRLENGHNPGPETIEISHHIADIFQTLLLNTHGFRLVLLVGQAKQRHLGKVLGIHSDSIRKWFNESYDPWGMNELGVGFGRDLSCRLSIYSALRMASWAALEVEGIDSTQKRTLHRKDWKNWQQVHMACCPRQVFWRISSIIWNLLRIMFQQHFH